MAAQRPRQIRPTEYLVEKTTILIVDDEMGPRESLRMILAPANEVILADCAPEALEVLRSSHVDLVTVDLNMPGMKGDELMRIIRRDFPDTEVVVITGCSSVETAVEGIRYGICDYLLKPFDVTQVNNAVGHALSRQQNRRRLVSFLEGIGSVLGKHRDTRELLAGLSRNVDLQARLHAAVQEPVLTSAPERAKVSADRTVEFLEILAETIESWDPALRGHSRRVAFYAGLLAEHLGLDSEEQECVRIASLLHDLGKVGVTGGRNQSRQLEATARRTPPEQHPEIGERLVRPLGFSGAVALAIRHHHERWDGNGYPDALRGDAIPLASRIIALAEVFDAMTSDRSDCRRLAPTEAAAELEKYSGSRFDPRLVEEFLTSLHNGTDLLEEDADGPPAGHAAREQASAAPMSLSGEDR
jgi:putative nucleotidyltransferase with HDIG domain